MARLLLLATCLLLTGCAEPFIVCAGGVLPISTLKEAGIAVETKYGTA